MGSMHIQGKFPKPKKILFQVKKWFRVEHLRFESGITFGNLKVLHNLSVDFRKGRLSYCWSFRMWQSTLVDMVAGLNVPDEGQVLINDVPITAVDIKQWRKQIGYVAQEMFLQNDTVRNNVLIGRTVLAMLK